MRGRRYIEDSNWYFNMVLSPLLCAEIIVAYYLITLPLHIWTVIINYSFLEGDSQVETF